jgi:hypothetical protein
MLKRKRKRERMKLINLCPHDINIIDSNDNIYTILAEKKAARIIYNQQITAHIDVKNNEKLARIFVYEMTDIEKIDVPPPVEGIIYIVSSMVKNQLPERSDLYSPLTDNSAVRGHNGNIIAVRGLQK